MLIIIIWMAPIKLLRNLLSDLMKKNIIDNHGYPPKYCDTFGNPKKEEQ